MIKFKGFRSAWLSLLSNVDDDYDSEILHKFKSTAGGFIVNATPVFAYQNILEQSDYDKITHDNAIQKTNKVHLTYCKKIKDAPGKYHVTSRADGFFNINIRNSKKVIELEEILLPMGVCQYCIRELFPNFLPPLGQDIKKCSELANNFSFADFVHEGLALSNIAFDEESVLNKFIGERDWYQFSRDLRAKHNWNCEDCGVNLFKYKQYLHVHHLNHSYYWNTPANCKVLCISCHAEQENHSHMKNQKQYKLYKELLNNKKIMSGT